MRQRRMVRLPTYLDNEIKRLARQHQRTHAGEVRYAIGQMLAKWEPGYLGEVLVPGSRKVAANMVDLPIELRITLDEYAQELEWTQAHLIMVLLHLYACDEAKRERRKWPPLREERTGAVSGDATP